MARAPHGGAMARLAPLLVIGATTAAMAVWTWNTWADPMVDFGRELYLAWLVSRGRLLYADVASFNGPLSPYVNAAWFHLFGVSIRSLVIGNLIVLAVLMALLWRILTAIASRLAATSALVVFATLFAFGEYDVVGNYNYVTPYSHELVHGVVLALASMLCLTTFAKTAHRQWLFGAALLFGCVLLTKAEVFVSAAGALSVGLVLVTRQHNHRPRVIGGFVLASLIPGVVATLLFARSLPAAVAFADVLTPLRLIVSSDVSGSPFYQHMAGIDDPLASVLMILIGLAGYALVLGGAAAVARYAANRRSRTELVTLGCFAAFLVLLVTGNGVVRLVGRPLPLIMLALIADLVFGRSRIRDRNAAAMTDAAAARASRQEPSTILQMMVAVFGGLLLLKMGLSVQLGRYGFVLAMPATLMTVIALVDRLPDRLREFGADGNGFRAIALTSIGTVILLFLTVHALRIQNCRFTVGTGPDMFRADRRGAAIDAITGELARRTSAADRLVVIPEGAMLNFLTRRDSSSPFPSFMPPELAMFGEADITASITRDPPEFVALIDRPMTEYDPTGHTSEFMTTIENWLNARYSTVSTAPGDPDLGGAFGIRLLKRN